MKVHIDVDDVLAFNPELDRKQVEILLADGLAMAKIIAPCIEDDDFAFPEAAEAIIRGAVLRWAESGSGAVTQKSRTAGPFSLNESFDTRQTRRSLFFPSERIELEKLCKNSRSGAFGLNMIVVSEAELHSPTCSWHFDPRRSVCDCGAWLNAGKGPLW